MTPATPVKLRQCRDVELFTTKGLPGLYTREDMRNVVRKFYELGPHSKLSLHRPPLGIGHVDSQDVLTSLLNSDPRLKPWIGAAKLDGDDAPAGGWITNLRAVPDEDDPSETKLVGDFDDIPEPVADLIDAKAYRQVSAEIYDDFPGPDKTHGKVLRRVALCGWQPPMNKDLADLPPTTAKYAEPMRMVSVERRPAKRPGTYLCFSEYRPMDKAQMLAALKTKGLTLTDAAGAAMSDAEVAAVYKKFSEPPMPAPVPVPPPAVKMDEPPTRDQMIAEMQAAGQDAAQLAALDDATLMSMYAQWKATNPPAPAPTAAAMAEVKQYAETVKTLVNTLQIEVAKAKTSGEQIKKYAEETAKTHKAARIASHRLDLVGANGSGIAYVTPAEFDTVHAKTLESLDDNVVQKFAEPNGKEFTETPFANYVRRLKSLPAKKVFAEKIGEPNDPNANPEQRIAGEKNKVRVYAETNESAVKAFGYTPAQYVQRFEDAAKKIPDLTAEKFIGAA